MSNDFPGLSAGLAEVQYDVVLTGEVSASYPSGTTEASYVAPSLSYQSSLPPSWSVAFGFISAEDGSGNLTFDYSWFDQTTIEADISGQITALLTSLSGMLGVPLASLQAGVKVRRTWTFGQNPTPQTGPEYDVRVVDDFMAYP